MKFYKPNLILCILVTFIYSIGHIHAQEICDNATDDDNDGFIDLNDSDCNCSDTIIQGNPISLVPNPSFEDYSCIPTSFSQLDCADNWIQAHHLTHQQMEQGLLVFIMEILTEQFGMNI